MHKLNFIPYLFCLLLLPTIVVAQYQEDAKIANEYYGRGETDKAREMYDKLEKNKTAIPIIHSNYFNLLVESQDWKSVEKYMDRALKFYPNNLQYHSDLIYFYHISNQLNEKGAYEKSVLKTYQKSQYQLNILAQNLVSREMHDDAILFLNRARKANGNPHSFSLELAAIYRMKGDKEAMTEEYLNYAMSNPGNLNYIKNIFQTLLDNEEDLAFLESVLISKVQQHPGQLTYAELLVWIELQRKDFYAAFIQARAMDKRMEKPGDECMKIAKIAMDNRAWSDAIEIYEYVIREYGDNYHYANARKLLIRSKEGKVKSTYPLAREEIKQLTVEYQQFYEEVGANLNTLDAMRNKAMLHAFYLDEKGEAIRILEDIIAIPRLNNSLLSSCKLSLGDIYLLSDNPWEASLLYSQVEKANKYAETGYEAKLKNAKLHYFTGNFILARAQLDVLKNATTKVIANDAIELSLLISNNTAYDTTFEIMRKYATIELLLYQNKFSEAENGLQNLIANNPTHSLVDESHWLLSEIYMNFGDFDLAIEELDKILTGFEMDVLADDAAFRKAVLTDENLGDLATAKELYREFLVTYPGSMYAADARKRFRQLRGDHIN